MSIVVLPLRLFLFIFFKFLWKPRFTVDHIVRSGGPQLPARGMIASRSAHMAWQPRAGYLPSLEAATPENKYSNSKLSSDTKESTHKVRKSVSQVVL